MDAEALMKWLAALLLVFFAGNAAHAESCTRSLDYILNDLVGDLPEPGQAYQGLFRVCLQTLELNNVDDAYVLKDGGIAVLPKDNSLIATASTLSAFCRQNPRATLRFITPREKSKGLTTGLVVLMSSQDADPCQKILGTQ
jgi:hypothetical protein